MWQAAFGGPPWRMDTSREKLGIVGRYLKSRWHVLFLEPHVSQGFSVLEKFERELHQRVQMGCPTK